MPIPANFGGYPREELHHHYRTVAAEFRKTLKTSKEVAELQIALERYLNVMRHLDWHRKNSDVYRKDESERKATRLVNEFNRYLESLESNQEEPVPQNLLNTISEIDQLVESLQTA